MPIMGSAVASHSANVRAKARLTACRELPKSKMRKFAITGLLGILFAATVPVPASATQATKSSAVPSSSNSTHKSATTAAGSKKKKSSHRRSSRREPFQKAPTPDRISEIQTALSRGGYFEGQPNGKWDSNTIAAMQKFQSANGLNSSGKIDATSLQKLGLGSSTAGVDAPKPAKRPDPSAATSAASRTSANNTNSASTAVPAPGAVSPASSKPPQH
jgi:peptidoglycan hydrolase-like protein with peptidoglycan-binding domain